MKPKPLLLIPFFLCFLPMMSTAQNINKNVDETRIPYHDEFGKWGYLHAQTEKMIISPKYDRVQLFEDGIAEVANLEPGSTERDPQFLIGLIDSNGREIFAPRFSGKYEVKTITNTRISGLFTMTTPDGKSGVVRTDGSWLIPLGKYDQFQFYNERQYLIDDRIFYNDGQKYSIPKKYSITQIYTEEKLFEVQKNELFKGILSWNGAEIVPTDYLEISFLPEAKRFVASRLKSGSKRFNSSKLLQLTKKLMEEEQEDPILIELRDEKGKLLKSFSSKYVANVAPENPETASFEYLNETYFFNLNTGKITESNPAQSHNYRIFTNNNLMGLKDADGQLIIPAEYAQLKFIQPDLIIAENENFLFGILNTRNEQITAFDYQNLRYAGKGMILARKDGKYGMLDLKGKILIPIIYQNDFYFDENGQANVRENDLEGIIDRKGKVIIPIAYNTLFSTKSSEKTNQAFYTVEKNGLWGLLDSIGNTMIPVENGFVSVRKKDFDYGWVKVEDKDRNKHGLYNIKTKVTIPFIYDIIQVYPDFLIVAVRKENNYFYQLLNPDGQALTSNDYTQMDYQYGYLSCRQNKLYGVLNTKGQILVPFVYQYLWEKTPHILMAQKEQDYYYINTKGKEFKTPLE